jgi:hypothetical protein
MPAKNSKPKRASARTAGPRSSRNAAVHQGGGAVLLRQLAAPRTVVVPQYQRRVLFTLNSVSSTSPTVNYNDLLLQEGKTAGYTAARFKTARVLGVTVWGRDVGSGSSPNTDGDVGLLLREGEPAAAFNPVGSDYGAAGVQRPCVRAMAGVFLSQKWQSGSDAFATVTDGTLTPLSPLPSPDFFSGFLLEVNAAFR